jgi:hypothetical protein
MLITTDASIFEIEPKSVVYPASRENLVTTIQDLLLQEQPFTQT